VLIGSSSNDSNNTSKETAGSNGSGGGGGDPSDTVKLRRSTVTELPAAEAEDQAAGSPRGSWDDEWSRQLDELDQLRPGPRAAGAGAGAAGAGFDVVDSFSDLPDVVVDDDVDDDVNDDAKQTAVEQVMSRQVATAMVTTGRIAAAVRIDPGIRLGAHCRHLANMTERCVRGGDAASCQITLATYFYYKREVDTGTAGRKHCTRGSVHRIVLLM